MPRHPPHTLPSFRLDEHSITLMLIRRSLCYLTSCRGVHHRRRFASFILTNTLCRALFRPLTNATLYVAKGILVTMSLLTVTHLRGCVTVHLAALAWHQFTHCWATCYQTTAAFIQCPKRFNQQLFGIHPQQLQSNRLACSSTLD